MTKPEAIAFLAQAATDLLAMLPKSAQPGFQQIAQQAIKVLEAPEPPKEPGHD